jgi:hypothetical protein
MTVHTQERAPFENEGQAVLDTGLEHRGSDFQSAGRDRESAIIVATPQCEEEPARCQEGAHLEPRQTALDFLPFVKRLIRIEALCRRLPRRAAC